MKLNRKRVVTGLVATGLVAGALAGGGVAIASTGAAPASATSTSAGPSYGPGSGHFGGMYGMHGVWSGQQPVMKAAADYLGLSLTQLQTQLRLGKPLADITQAQGKPVSGLKDAILAAMTSRINANTALTAQQKAAMISEVKDHLDTVINMDMDMPHSPGTGMGLHMTGTDSPMGWM
ncbi:MAG TPA: hypothetical protein VIK57_08485 [Streptosporangiaceae bacterium]|jgi:hypothetical protein